jgi:prepilin-type N-terminal cleavage/methylation domain-containing protein
MKRSGQNGTTIIELMVVISVFSIVALATYELVINMMRSNAHISAWNNLTSWGESATIRISEDVTRSRVLYQADDTGEAYRAWLDISANYPVVANSQLPVIDELGTICRDDVGLRRTGNGLMFAMEMTPFSAVVGGTTRRCDIMRLVFYYLTSVNRPIAGNNTSLLLIRWESIEYAHSGQVNAISDAAQRQAFARALYEDRGVRYLWDPRAIPTAAFWAIDEWGVISADPEVQPPLTRNNEENVIPNLGHGNQAVAFNRSANFWGPDDVPNFARANNNFPGGFEVQIIGATGARQIFTRLVLAWYLPVDKTLETKESTNITSIREY